METVAEKLYTPYGLRTLSEDEKERLLLVKMLEQTGNNRSKTAKLLNMSRTTLYEKLKRNGII